MQIALTQTYPHNMIKKKTRLRMKRENAWKWWTTTCWNKLVGNHANNGTSAWIVLEGFTALTSSRASERSMSKQKCVISKGFTAILFISYFPVIVFEGDIKKYIRFVVVECWNWSNKNFFVKHFRMERAMMTMTTAYVWSFIIDNETHIRENT